MLLDLHAHLSPGVRRPDLIGVDRGRDVLVGRPPSVLEHGLAFETRFQEVET
ncbi:hypothetical protein [Actinoallomurus sp. NPDC052274]|uniref:hypothetical protein n=1 Tax=Actinoallomurus sp. NPDC052274 TaxID=3155420 RepID=UPI0034389EA7